MTTDLEAFRDTCAFRRPARLLYHAGFVQDLHQRVVAHIGTDDYMRHYGFFAPAGVGPRRRADLPPLDYARYWEGQELPPGTRFDGVGVAMVPSGFYHFWGYVSPLRHATSLRELEEYPLPAPGDFDDTGLAARVAELHAQGRVAMGGIGHMFETAWQIRGLEPFMEDLVERPAWAECLLERLYQLNRAKARACARAGVDYLMCGDDVATQKAMMMNRRVWRDLFHSRWAALWAEAKTIHPGLRTWYHSDGNILDIVPALVDAGLDILNPLQPECLDIDAVYRQFRGRLVLDGCMGTQSTMPFGTPDDVRRRVRECIERYGESGGLILCPTHVLEPEVPIANIEAFVEACREYRQ